MAEANTLDLRGHEQVCNRKQAEEYAAFKGYSMMFFGYSEEPQDVSPDCYLHEGFKVNPLLTKEEVDLLKGRMDCRDCDGSGVFYQIEGTPCACITND
jgi:hypothetical protein